MPPASFTTDDPELVRRLADCRLQGERIAALDRYLETLTEATAAKTAEARRALLARYSTIFRDVNPKHALIGMDVSHTITLADVATFQIRQARAIDQQELQAFISQPDHAAFLPVSASEGLVVCSLVSVKLCESGGEPQRVAGRPVKARLELLRQLPVALIEALATAIQDMDTWLRTYLGEHLGN